MKNEKAVFASIEVERNGDGFLAKMPALQGAFAEGDTIDEAVFNLIDVAKMIIEYKKEKNELTGFTEFKLKKNLKISFSIPMAIS